MHLPVARFSLTAPRYFLACCLLVAGMVLPQLAMAASTSGYWCQADQDADGKVVRVNSSGVVYAPGTCSINTSLVCPSGYTLASVNLGQLVFGNPCPTSPSDNCPTVANADQADTDGDGIGNACEGDAYDNDGDGVGNDTDNCPLISNANQLNTDGDANGNVCDTDDDNDGVLDGSDKFPLDASESADADNDGIGNNADTDNDNDGVADVADNCPFYANAGQADDDLDGIGNPCDSDGAGKLDTSFNPGTGANDLVSAMALQPDGKVLIGGYFTAYNGTSFNRIARLNSDGALDTSFNPGTGANNAVQAMAQQADGKVLIGGDFTAYNGTSINGIARLNSDGSLDVAFNPGTGANHTVKSIAIQSDGKVLIGGNHIARLNSDGSLDASFNPGSDAVRTMALQADGKVLISGGFTAYIGTAINRIARLNSDGSLDTSFNPGIGANAYVYAMALQSDGKVLIGGDFTAYNGTSINYIARLNSDGSLDASFNTGANGRVSAFALQPDGKVLIGGFFTAYNGTSINRIARLNSDGSLDTSFNPGAGVNGYFYAMAEQADGRVLIGGMFTRYNSTTINRIARIHTGDADNDGIENAADNCSLVVNADQLDADGDGIGDVCDTTPNGDTDGDGIDNLADNCQSVSNADQLNSDGDAQGNICDNDDDNDGVADASDAFPLDATESADTDGDGIGNNADSTPNGDTDNDGVDNLSDNCPSVSNADQLNTDGDSEGNACDSDDDNDGVADVSDAFPLDATESADTDGDGIGNNADTTPNGDTDSDGIDNLADNCVSVSNVDQLNADNDSEGNACDSDDDNDGVADSSDAFPLDASESADTDGDGIGNNADTTPNGDTDGDGVDNAADNCVAVANADQLNSDGDSQGNACDNDDDNDGVPDASDAFPLDASESADTDGDGIGDNVDNCLDLANTDQLNADGDVQGDACDVYPNDPTLLLQQDGAAKNEKLGSSVALADMNNDGVVDLLVGSPLANVTVSGAVLKKAGQIQIISGKDNSVLRSINGSAPNEQLGAALAVVADQNKDGVRDIIVGNPLADVTTLVFNGFPVLKDAGRVMLYSGLDGRMLRILAEGKNVGDHFGAAVAVGDVNGDGKVDLIVGTPRADSSAKDAGQVTVFNSLSKKILYQRNGEQVGENFGTAVAVDNGHLFVGAPLYDTLVASNTGRVSVFNSSEGNSTALLKVYGALEGDAFGSAVTAANGSWAAGAPLADGVGKDAGSVQVYSGMNTTPVKTLIGKNTGDNFGNALNMQGDVNKDGKNDIAIGAVKFDVNATALLKDAGRVEVLSGVALQ